MPYATADIISWAEISQGLALRGEAKKKATLGGSQDIDLDNILRVERMSLQWQYQQDPTNADGLLFAMGNYVYALCFQYVLEAQLLSGDGGLVVDPVVPSGAAASVFPVSITETNFSTSTDYDDPRIVGKNLMIFYNEINRYLIPGIEFSYTVTGVSILVPGFDAKAVGASIHMVIENVSAGAAAGGSGSSLLISTYYGDTDYYPNLISNNDNVPYNGTAAGLQGSPMSVTFNALASDPAGKFLVFKIASSQTDKTTWANTGTLNSGTIPDSVFREQISFGGYDYYLVRPHPGGYVFDPAFLTIVLT